MARQVDLARAYAGREGWTVGDGLVFVDEAVSGGEFDSRKRPGLAALLAASQSQPRPFDVLVTVAQSRLSRRSRYTGDIVHDLIDRGVQIVFYQTGESLKLDTATGRFMVSVHGFADDASRESIRVTTRETLRRKVERGEVGGGRTRQYELRTGITSAAPAPALAGPSVLAQLMVRPGEAPLNAAGQHLVSGLEHLPEGMHADIAHAVRNEFPKIVAAVRGESAPPRREETEAAMRTEWGTEYGNNKPAMDCAFDTLSSFLRDEIDAEEIRDARATWRLMSRFGRRILRLDGPGITPQGEAWMKARGTKDHEGRQRSKAEEIERERRANELLGR